MGETEKLDKAPKESWFTGLSAEFKKIIWPEKQSLVRQTTAVIAVSVVLVLSSRFWISQFSMALISLLVLIFNGGRVIYGRGTLVCCSYLLRI